MKKILTILISLLLIISILPMEALAVSASDFDDLERYFKDYDINVDYILASGNDVLDAGASDTLIVMLYNRTGETIRNASLSLELPSGVSIAYGAENQIIGTFKSRKAICVEFPIVVDKDITGQSAKITANVAGYVSGDYNEETGEREDIFNSRVINESFFIPVKSGSGSGSDATNPVLLLSNYSCGGSVIAGSTFGLGLTLLNTSNIDLHNIKVTVSGAAFVPVGSSNSFYIDTILAGQSVNKTMTMSCAKDTLQGAQSITVSSVFNEGDSTDTISIPVVQETRLVIDDILDPGWLTMSDQAYASVSYRNMGNNQINNLTITVDGDFDLDGNPLYYVGNVASGRQDNYSFNFYPRQEGECKGSVTFTYEDADGNEHHIEKTFVFNIGPAYNYDDEGDYDIPIEEPGFVMPIWGWAIVGVVAIVLIIVIIKLIKKRKAKKQEAFDLDV